MSAHRCSSSILLHVLTPFAYTFPISLSHRFAPGATAMTATIKHPLEPLTAQEVALAVTLLKDAGKVTPTTRFVSVSLKEPAKELVHAAKSDLKREAFAVLFDNATNSCYETSLSLTDRKLLSWKHIPGVQPTMTSDEQVECEQAVLAS